MRVSFGRARRVAAIGAAAALLAVSMSGGVVSAHSGTITRTGATLTYNNHTLLAFTTWTVDDTKADGLCARAYMKRAGSWHYLGQTCGKDTKPNSGRALASAQYMKVCTGVPKTPQTNCSIQKAT